MKKSLFFLFLIYMSFTLSAQEFIQNSNRPLNRYAGRTLQLEEIYVIKDNPSEYYFAWPRNFLLDSNGHLFLLDENQLLKFSPEGKFEGNFFKKGQGPGEISSPYQMISAVMDRDELYMYDGVAKIVHLDNNGKLIDKVTQSAGRFFQLMGLSENGFYMRYQTSSFAKTVGFHDIDNQIHLLTPDGNSAEKIMGFPSQIYGGPNFGTDWSRYSHLFNQKDETLYVTHTCEYKIVRADLKEGKIIVSFNREYPRIKFTIPEDLESFYKEHDIPKKKFENDVAAMYLNNDFLWVETSTEDKNKGLFFDVFDPQGRYVDCFYLNIDGSLVLADGDFIYITQRDADENILIKKLKILN